MDTTTEKLEKEPLVSILMLTYNRARYIQNAIESVLAQTYKNWELIIIDDGSTDETHTIVEAYADERIHYKKRSKNKGLFARRAESLHGVRGAYVAILDSDDVWSSSGKLATQVTFMEEHSDCAVVGTFIQIIDSHNNPIGKDSYNTNDKTIRNSILIRNQFAHSSVLMRKSMLDATKGYQPTLAEDLELFLQLGRIGTFANIPEFLTSYRRHDAGTNDYGIDMARALSIILRRNKSMYPRYYAAMLKNVLRFVKGYVKILLHK